MKGLRLGVLAEGLVLTGINFLDCAVSSFGLPRAAGGTDIR